MRKPKVVHFSSVHRADDPRIFDKECHSLREAGFDVTLIARADSDREIDGISVLAFHRPRGGTKVTRILRTLRQMLSITLRERAAVYHFHDPELLPVGVILRLLGKRVIYDSHETTRKQLRSATWVPAPLRPAFANVIGSAERFATYLFNGVVAATPGIAEGFQRSKTVVAQNFPRLEGPLGEPPPDDYLTREPVVAYIGTISPIRGLFEMIEAMERLGPTSDARLSLGGTFQTTDMHRRAVATPGWDRIDELGWLDRASMAEVLHKSRIGLLPLHPEPNYLDSYPVKLFEYMLAGVPVVASDIPFWRQFVSDIGAGIMVNPKDPADIASAIRYLLDHPEEARAMGQCGREAVLENFSWEQEARRLIGLYRRVLG